MAKKAEVRKAFETVLGHELPADIGDEVVLRAAIAVSEVVPVEGAFVTSREIGTEGTATKACSNSAALDVGGTSRTAPDGKARFALSNYHCLAGVVLRYPVNFVATAQSKAPVFLTSVQRLTAAQPGPFEDVEITVFAWDANGKPQGNVSFDWRCVVPWKWPDFVESATRAR